jgi:hypothetical protein
MKRARIMRMRSVKTRKGEHEDDANEDKYKEEQDGE